MMRKISKVQYEKLGRAVAFYAATVATYEPATTGQRAEMAIVLGFLANTNDRLAHLIAEAGADVENSDAVDFLRGLIADTDGARL
jgi:hypothetical protein